MLTFPLGKAPSTFPSLGGTSVFLKAKEGYTLGDENTPAFEPSAPGGAGIADFNCQFIFWAKPNSTSNLDTVVQLNQADQTSDQYVKVFLNKSRIRVLHRANQNRAGVNTRVNHLDITYTANLANWNHYMIFYNMADIQDDDSSVTNYHADYKLFVNGVDVDPTNVGTPAFSESGVSTSFGTTNFIRTVGGMEEVFATGSPGGFNFNWTSDWSGYVSGYTENQDKPSQPNPQDYNVSDQVADFYYTYYDSSGTYIGPTPTSSITGTHVDYTGVTVPSLTRPTV